MVVQLEGGHEVGPAERIEEELAPDAGIEELLFGPEAHRGEALRLELGPALVHRLGELRPSRRFAERFEGRHIPGQAGEDRGRVLGPQVREHQGNGLRQFAVEERDQLAGLRAVGMGSVSRRDLGRCMW